MSSVKLDGIRAQVHSLKTTRHISCCLATTHTDPGAGSIQEKVAVATYTAVSVQRECVLIYIVW